MVTCTTPPFRAAVRLNSGVRPGKSFPMLSASAIASHSAFFAFCWVGVGQRFARCASRFGRIASDSAGAPPPSAWLDLRVRAQVWPRRVALAGALSWAGSRRFGVAAPRLRLCEPRLACGSASGQWLSLRARCCCLRFRRFGRNVGPNNSSKPTPLRGAA